MDPVLGFQVAVQNIQQGGFSGSASADNYHQSAGFLREVKSLYSVFAVEIIEYNILSRKYKFIFSIGLDKLAD